MSLLANRKSYSSVPFSSLFKYAAASLEHHQVKLYVDNKDVLCGVFIWAWVTCEVVNRLRHDSVLPRHLHPSEWREGDILLVMDVVAKNNSFDSIRRDIKSYARANARAICWINDSGNKLTFKSLPQKLDLAERV
jgi:hemolysin-activating ACP:hemolysin acyltransferase